MLYLVFICQDVSNRFVILNFINFFFSNLQRNVILYYQREQLHGSIMTADKNDWPFSTSQTGAQNVVLLQKKKISIRVPVTLYVVFILHKSHDLIIFLLTGCLYIISNLTFYKFILQHFTTRLYLMLSKYTTT